ncbi:MAG: O-antigen ligase family protein [Oligoflexales bacterium]|nr:O-antigen ligase family protein [Oligoflexales bacterium]
MIFNKIDIKKYAIIVMLFTFGWCWDFINMAGNYQRIGRLKIFLIAAAVIGAVNISKKWGKEFGLFFFYIWFIYVLKSMPVFSTIEILIITASLFFIPEIFKNISPKQFQSSIIYTGVLHCIIGVFNLFKIFPVLPITNPHYSTVGMPPVGFLGQETLLGPYLVVALGFVLKRCIDSAGKIKFLYALISLLHLLIIYKCNSSMTFGSLAVMSLVFSVFYFGYKFSAIVLSALSSVFIVACLTIETFAFGSGRIEPWKDAIELIKDKPIFGYGTGFWSNAAQQIAKIRQYELVWAQLHNDVLQGLFEWGVVGMAFVLFAICSIAFKSHKLVAKKDIHFVPYVAGFFSLLANCLGNFTFHIVPHGVLVLMFAYIIINRVKIYA